MLDRNAQIGKFYYTACNKPAESIAFLRHYGIRISNPKDYHEIAKYLRHVVATGSEKEAREFLDLHPDKELLQECNAPAETNADGPAQDPAVVVQPASQAPVHIHNHGAPVQSQAMTYGFVGFLMGTVMTSMMLVVANYVHKNVKS